MFCEGLADTAEFDRTHIAMHVQTVSILSRISRRPRAATRQHDRFVVLTSLRDRTATASALRIQLQTASNVNVSNVNVSVQTIRFLNLYFRVFEFLQVKSDARTLREALAFLIQFNGSKHEVMIAANVGTWERPCVCFVGAGLEAGLAGLKDMEETQQTKQKKHAGPVEARINNDRTPLCKTPEWGR